MLKLVIFDLDNTLYDYKTCNEKALKAVFEYLENNFKITKEDFENTLEETKMKIKKQLGNTASSHNRAIYFKQFLQKIDMNPLTYTNILYDLYWNTFLDNMYLFEDVLKLFDFLKSKQIKISICTNLTTNIQIKKIKKLNLQNYIDYLITSEEIGVDKPDKSMFINVLEYFKLLPEETIFVGDDFNNDILGAQKAGIDGILISKSKGYNCKVLSNFKELLLEFSKKIDKNKFL